MLTKNELLEVTAKICEIERYNRLIPLKRKRNVLEAENGDTIIIASSKSNVQGSKGNFHEIIHDDEVWVRINNNSQGAFYFVYIENGKMLYYRTDIKTVIINRSKDKASRDKNRYLCSKKNDKRYETRFPLQVPNYRATFR